MVFRKKIVAFSIMEVLIVLALSGIIISLVAFAINRLNEQIAKNMNLQNELIQIQTIRTIVFNDFHQSDSIHFIDGKVTFWKMEGRIEYKHIQPHILNRQFIKGQNGVLQNVSYKQECIGINKTEENINFEFLLKGDIISVTIPLSKDLSTEVNNFFEKKRIEYGEKRNSSTGN